MVQMRPSQVQITVTGDLRLNAESPQVFEAPGGLYPLRSKAFEIDEYRIMAGWPVPIPKYDIFARSMVSASGERFTSRDDPNAINTNATVRWIADPEFYDEDALVWRPIQDATQGSFWNSSTTAMPVLVNDYTYRLGSEVFVQNAVNFDSDANKHLWGNFSTSIGGSAGYTVVMVFSPNSYYGNNDAIPFNGIWAPGNATPDSDTFDEPLPEFFAEVTSSSGWLYYEDELKERTRAVSIATALSENTPVYLAMIFTRPEVTFYVGQGPSSIQIKTLPAGTQGAVPLNGNILLGRTPGDQLHTADMALFDIGIYGTLLSAVEVQAEFSALAQAYGGVSK